MAPPALRASPVRGASFSAMPSALSLRLLSHLTLCPSNFTQQLPSPPVAAAARGLRTRGGHPKGKGKDPKARRDDESSVPRRVTPLTLAAGDKDRRFFKLCMFIITYLAYVFCQYIFEAASTRHRRLVLFVVNAAFLLSLVFVQIRHKQAVDSSAIEHNYVLKTRQEVTSPDVRAIEEG